MFTNAALNLTFFGALLSPRCSLLLELRMDGAFWSENSRSHHHGRRAEFGAGIGCERCDFKSRAAR
jgi:hypothetical protein